MEISFKGKRALVTGASKGIGKDLAIQLTKCGAQVVAIAIEQELLDNLKTEAPSIEIILLDITNWNTTKQILDKIGPIDLLVNNAGLVILAPLTELTEKHVDAHFNLNIKAIMNVSQWMAQQLISRKSPGAIVNISSQASIVGLEKHAVYCASKGAVDAFTRAAALELGPHGIRVNCVNPTVVMTELGRQCWSDPKVAEPMKEKIPLKRFCEVREVVNVVLFLLSDKASMITGTCLPVDGGYTST